MKRNLRDAPEETLHAEDYASLAWLDGNPYPSQELTDAWKKIAFNDFHDLAAGSGIADIYRDAQKDFDQVRWETHEILSKALNTLAAAGGYKHAARSSGVCLQPAGMAALGAFQSTCPVALRKRPMYRFWTRMARRCPRRSSQPTPQRTPIGLLAKRMTCRRWDTRSCASLRAKAHFQADLRVTGTTLENRQPARGR